MKKVFYLILCILLVALVFAPFILSTELRFGVFKSKELYIVGIGSLFAFIAGLYFLYTRKIFLLHLNFVDIAIFILQSYIVVRIFVENTNYFYLDKFAIGSVISLTYFVGRVYFTIFRWRKAHLILEFLGFLFVLLGSGQAVIALLQYFGYISSYNTNFSSTGTFANPAPLAFLLASIAPIVLCFYFHTATKLARRQPSKHYSITLEQMWLYLLTAISSISLFLILVVLLILQIRTGWLMALTGVGVVILAVHKQWLLNFIKKKGTGLSVALVLIPLIPFLIFLYFFKEDSADGRLLIYNITISKILEKPFFGHGYNSFYAQYNNWQAEWFSADPLRLEGISANLAGNVQFAFNEFLEIWVEMGLIGLLLFLFILLTLIKGFLKANIAVAKDKNRELRSKTVQLKKDNYLVIGFAGMLFSFIVGSLTYSPLHDVIGHFLFFLSMAVLSSFLPIGGFCLKIRNSALLKSCSTVIALVSFMLLSSNVYGKYNALENWEVANKWFRYEAYSRAEVQYESLYDLLRHEHIFLQEYAKLLYIRGAYTESLVLLDEARPYGTDVYGLITRGDNLRNLGEYNKAENSFKRAAAMQPSMWYPNYLLIMLYLETDRKRKAQNLAKQLITKDIKVPSEAINEIKKEIRKLIDTSSNSSILKEERRWTAKYNEKEAL